MNSLLGANWRTTISNAVALIFATATAIAAAPSELDILPTALYPYRDKIIAICGVIAFVARLVNGAVQKDKAVTGGSVQQTIEGNKVEPGKQSLVDATLEASPPSEKAAVVAQREATDNERNK
jgi:hypothetical protein